MYSSRGFVFDNGRDDVTMAEQDGTLTSWMGYATTLLLLFGVRY